METPAFSELNLDPALQKAVDKLGFESASPIQAATIPVALEGKDIVGLSQTGSGKTAAFGLPTLMQLDLTSRHTQAVILCPTRELCVQVCEEIHRLGAFLKNFHAIPVYGGAPIDRQIRSLREGCQLVVGTPGRFLDHIKRRTLKLDHVKVCILDEADRMLDMGFRDDMEDILGACPEGRQTLFFSATMNKGVERLIQHFGNNPQQILIKQKALTVSSVEQTAFEVRNRSKIEVVSRLLDMSPPRLAIVFCNTKRAVDDCCDALIGRGYSADRIHGDITQTGRERVLKKFKAGHIELLVATDVAARGLDIDEVDAVFNFDLPQDPEDYVHRIGRTGRAGRSGKAYSFVFGKDVYRLNTIEKYIRQKITRAGVPSQEDITGQRANVLLETIKERLESGNYKPHQELTDRLLEQGHTATDIINVLFSMIREKNQRESESIQEDREEFNPDKPFGRGGGGGRSGGGGGNRGGRSNRGGERHRGARPGGHSRDRAERGDRGDSPSNRFRRPDSSESRGNDSAPRRDRSSAGGERAGGARSRSNDFASSKRKPWPSKDKGDGGGDFKKDRKSHVKKRTNKDKGKPSWSKKHDN